MKAKKRVIYAGVLTAGVVLVLALLVTVPSRSGVTKEHCDRIKAGMTLAEVQNIFGKQGVVFHGFVDKRAYCWENEDRSYAMVFFDDERDVVQTAKWEESSESLVDKIRRMMRWPWWK